MTIREELGADHARLAKMFRTLVDTVEGADLPDVARTWAEFEGGLLAHLDVEEKRLFPLLAHEHPDAVASALRQHARVRELIAELGVRAELHTIRKWAVDELVALLAGHAAFEDEMLYPLADAAMDEVRQRLALQSLREDAQRRAGELGARIM